jgi:hypothetical protein
MDLERIQTELKSKLDSEAVFEFVNVVKENALDAESDAAQQLAALTNKGGRTGLGIVVGDWAAGAGAADGEPERANRRDGNHRG